jgi:hypothetical protein
VTLVRSWVVPYLDHAAPNFSILIKFHQVSKECTYLHFGVYCISQKSKRRNRVQKISGLVVIELAMRVSRTYQIDFAPL